MSEQVPELVAEPTIPKNAISMSEWETLDRVEVVNGEIVQMSPVKASHVILMTNLFLAINRFLTSNPIGHVFPDSMPYVLEGDERTDWVRGSRIPDVSFVSNEKLSDHNAKFGNDFKYFHLAPDLAIEIVSEHDRYSEIFQKITDYLQHGTQLVWIIDPQNRHIRVHTSDHPDGHTLRENDTLTGDPVLTGWSMSVATIFDTSLSSQTES